MSTARHQALRERITALLTNQGLPPEGTLHAIRAGSEAVEVYDKAGLSCPQSAEVVLLGAYGDEQYFDQHGYEVFAD